MESERNGKDCANCPSKESFSCLENQLLICFAQTITNRTGTNYLTVIF